MHTNRASPCSINVHIACDGVVNITNCSTDVASPTCEPPCPAPASCGLCVPVSPRGKRKLSRQEKLGLLAADDQVPSALAASMLHTLRRCLHDEVPATPLEGAIFDVCARGSTSMREALSCAIASFDTLPADQRTNLFDESLMGDPGQAIDVAALADAWTREIHQRAAAGVFGDPAAAEAERPGRIRVFTGEAFESQVRICRLNGLRTSGFRPLPTDWRPDELEQDCEIAWVEGVPTSTCEIKRPPGCPGNEAAGVCLRVTPVTAGDAVVLEGVNFFSVDATVLLTDKQNRTAREVQTHVWGDVDTPVTEEINGEKVLVIDCRVHDRLSFEVPADLAPGIYELQVRVPNITGEPTLDGQLVSQTEYLAVEPPSTARFEIAGESLHALKETGGLGSDEPGLTAFAVPVLADFALAPFETRPVYQRKFGDVDTGDRRDVNAAFFRNDQPIVAVALLILCDEVDNEDAWKKMTQDSWQLFFDAAMITLGTIHEAWDKGGKKLPVPWWAWAIAAGVGLALDAVWAWWAPADPLIRDTIGLSARDLAVLTDPTLPMPEVQTHTRTLELLGQELEFVDRVVTPIEKIPQQYRERREHRLDGRYALDMRYTRLA